MVAMVEKAWSNASQKPMPHSIKAAVAAAVKQKYTQKRASAVSLMRGRGLEEVGPVLSAFTIFVVPRPAWGKRATKMTMMPRPPSQWVMARKKRMNGGRGERSLMTVAPVPVRPDTLSTSPSSGERVPEQI